MNNVSEAQQKFACINPPLSTASVTDLSSLNMHVTADLYAVHFNAFLYYGVWFVFITNKLYKVPDAACISNVK